MIPFGVTIPATILQRSEIPEGLMNYPVLFVMNQKSSVSIWKGDMNRSNVSTVNCRTVPFDLKMINALKQSLLYVLLR